MVFLRMGCYFVVFILMGYSVLRYFHLWSRTKIPNVIYFVFQVCLLGTLFVCHRKVPWIPNEIFRNILQGISAVYLSILLYTPIFCFVRGVIRFIGKKRESKGRVFRFFNHPANSIYLILAITAFIGGFSFFNMRHVVVNEYSFTVNKRASEKDVTIAMISDAHLGSAVTRQGLDSLIEKTNEMKPDIIVLCGDIFDENTTEELKKYASLKMKEFQAKLGVFYVEGNHEMRLNEDFTKWFADAGITVLRDQTACLVNGVQLVGIRDKVDSKKKPLRSLMAGLDSELPVIVLSHRPKQLQEMADLGADLVLSGHTHGGQYPLGFIPILMSNDMNYGLKKYGTMDAVTTSGAGGYGIPSKLTVPSEILKIKISFSDNGN